MSQKAERFFSFNTLGITLHIKVQPGAHNTGWAGPLEDRIKVRLTARAVDGQANEALCQFLSDFFKTPKTHITILKGQSSREKSVFISGDPEQLSARAKHAIGRPD